MSEKTRPFRIVMIGAGAMGSMFGARFSRAGADVVLYDRDREHLEAIARDRLRLDTPEGELRLRLAVADDPAAVAQADLAVILVDSNATPEAARIAGAVLRPEGFALTLQNGIGNIEALAEILGSRAVLGGTTYNSAARLGPGHVLHSNEGLTVIGEVDGAVTDRIRLVGDLFRGAGLPVEVSGNVMGHIWMKFVLNAAINPVAAVTGMRPGEIARNASARRLLESLLDEILAVVAAKGIVLSEDDPRAAVIGHAFERYNRPSMLQHVEQGRRTEIDALNGALLREASALRIACPVNETIVLAVKAIDARSIARHADPHLDESALEAAARAEIAGRS
jgi:2-dehydropantoate 2-reductase